MRSAIVVRVVAVSMVGLPACTVVKPLVCSVAFPVSVIKGALEDDEEESDGEEDYRSTPAVLAIPTAIVTVPVVFVTASAVGIVGGLTSGVASDLNLILGNARMEDTGESLKYPFRTNVCKPGDE